MTLMKTYEPWAVAAVFLMQKVNGRAHYTNIVNYILQTELTELTERSVATSQTVNDTLKQKVIDELAVFKPQGNGYYSLQNPDVMLKREEIQGVIQALRAKGLSVTIAETPATPTRPPESSADDNEKLSSDARKLSENSRKLSDEIRNLCDETMRLSDQVQDLTDENKNLRQEAGTLRQENQQLQEKLQAIRQLCD